MNRFERLFFILEKYDNSLSGKDIGPRGVVKVTITAERIKIALEAENLPVGDEYLYEVVMFFKNKDQEVLPPKFIDVKCSPNGSIRDNMFTQYNGQIVFGAALAFRNRKNNGRKNFPLVSFKCKPDEWRKILEDVSSDENRKLQKEETRRKEASVSREHNASPRKDLEKISKILDDAGQRMESNKAESNNVAEERVSGKYDYLKVNKEELFDRSFKAFDPFNTTNKSYKWWYAKDMHQVNKILLEASLKLPFELNKEGYLSCEIFGHVLLGEYKDQQTSREFLIFGIPSKEKGESGNYYSNSRWEEVAESKDTSESGYWLTYIDCETSRVVKVI